MSASFIVVVLAVALLLLCSLDGKSNSVEFSLYAHRLLHI